MSIPRVSTQCSRIIAHKRLVYENKRWDLICVGVVMPLMVILIIPAASNSWQRDEKNPRIKVNKPAVYYRADIIALMSISGFFALVANITLYVRLRAPDFPKWVVPVTVLSSIMRVITSIAAYVIYAVFHAHNYNSKHVKYSGEYIMVTQFIVWWAIGAVVFMYLESWTFLQAIYFWIVAVATIGFGNFFPSYLASRLTWIVFEAVGIGLLAKMINTFVIVVFENIQLHTEQRIQELRRLRRRRRRRSEVQQTGMDDMESDSGSDITLAEDIGQTVADARKEKHIEQGKEVIKKITFAGVILMTWLLGAFTFSRTESWDFGTSFYFCFVSLTTTGFGDVVLRSATGVVLFIFFCLIGLGSMAYFGSVLSQMRLWILRYSIKQCVVHVEEFFNHIANCFRGILHRVGLGGPPNVSIDIQTDAELMSRSHTLRRFLPTSMTATTYEGPTPIDDDVLPMSEREAVVEDILDATRKLNRIINNMGRFLVDPRQITAQNAITQMSPIDIDSPVALTESPVESPNLEVLPPFPPPPPPSTPRLLLDERRRRSTQLLHSPQGRNTLPPRNRIVNASDADTSGLSMLGRMPAWHECQQQIRAITQATIRLLDIERDAGM
ncbi:hypothetical protein BDF19DRAFT_416756 [Syncephalis fuscata]|nr:hypothetical protein BDF19DRAFT_416756 [Syncephalis fuscata]